MDMSGDDMAMGDMSMGAGVPSLFTIQRMYWAVVGTAIGIATIANGLNLFLSYQRRWDTTATPAKPKSLLFRTYATATALVREVSYASLEPIVISKFRYSFPAVGPVMVILANLTTVIVLCFYKLNTMDQWSWEDIGYRTGFVTVCQIPLIFLLASKQNIVGYLTGSSYERLNWYHRWVARTLWLTTTIHMGFWFRSWGRYDQIIVKLTTDSITQRGFSGWCILTFILLISSQPSRRWSYEVFVIGHIVTFSGFIAAVWLHVPAEVKAWVYLSVGLVCFDRLVRILNVLYINLASLHFRSRAGRRLWANEAIFTPLPGNVTRITIPEPVISWKPGQHTFVSCHSLIPLQSHPFTIASIPSDNKIEFLVRAEKGGTRKFFGHASRHHGVLGNNTAKSNSTKWVALEGPYGQIRPLRQFDSVVFLAGGVGATLTVPLMRDIVHAWKTQAAGPPESRNRTAVKRIRFVWVIKSQSQLYWFSEQLRGVLRDIETCRQTDSTFDREIEMSIYVTCDDELNTENAARREGAQVFLSEPATGQEINNDEKYDVKKTVTEIQSIPSSDGPETSASGASGGCCQPGGGCCCTSKVEDEDADRPPCTCAGHAATSVSGTADGQTSPTPTITKETRFPDPSETEARLLSGRPQPRTIIRKVLEAAEGESAVIVCGPRGLADDARRSVVSLSDERAVHKGTGAQGIYFHEECFGYA